jgi:hypothetical protein
MEASLLATLVLLLVGVPAAALVPVVIGVLTIAIVPADPYANRTDNFFFCWTIGISNIVLANSRNYRTVE